MSFKNFVPIKEGNSVIFYLNTSGFPLASDVWNQMWTYAKEIQPNAIDKMISIQENKFKIPDVEVPVPPYVFLYNKSISNSEKIDKIQNYVDKLQYNHTGLQFFEIRKGRPLMGLADLSRKIIEDSLPIKCLEAVILSIYLLNEINYSNQLSCIEKFTIGFKTNSNGNIHRHVVLGVYCHSTGLFGALGLSRRSDLGFKNLKFKTLSDLIQDYINSYSSYLHKVKRIKIGNPIPNSNRSFETIPWNGCTINMNKQNMSEWQKVVEKHSRSIRHHLNSIQNQSNISFVRNKNKTYLSKHLDEMKQKSQLSLLKNIDKKEIDDSSILKCIEDDDENENSDEENLDPKSANLSSNQNILEKNYFSESITLLTDVKKLSSLNKNLSSNTNNIGLFNNYSATLPKRKQISLRV